MVARRHGQGRGALAPWKCWKVFHALVFTVKRSVDQLFMHYCQIYRRLLGASSTDPHQGSTLDPTKRSSFPDPLIFPPLEKILRAPRSCTSHWRLQKSETNIPVISWWKQRNRVWPRITWRDTVWGDVERSNRWRRHGKTSVSSHLTWRNGKNGLHHGLRSFYLSLFVP